MDRFNSRIAQTYGYAVCFITVIVMLISLKQVVDAVIDLSDPIRAEGGGYGRMGRPITNFEVYRLAARREPERGMLAGVLFGIHWRWLKQRDALPVTS